MSASQQILHSSPIAAEVYQGLMKKPKQLSPKLFYDARGSELFEQITELPEYYLTRTERTILLENAADIIQATRDLARPGNVMDVARPRLDQSENAMDVARPRATHHDLSLIELGAGTATKTRILIAATLKRQPRLCFYPIDVSRSALDEAVHSLNGDFRGLRVNPVVADYSQGLGRLAKTPGRKLLLYLGSSIGNFEPMQAGAMLRMMRSTLNKGERIHTENSYKFTQTVVNNILDLAGFTHEKTWTDPKHWFALHLARVM